ncbi:MAG: amidase family protein, partial [Candidatus Nanopelagicales bacterium]|nr:amidase family protein [Candidatus Nanopelagicales bacterium]
PFARTVLDCAMLHEVMAGHDPLDSTSINQSVPEVVKAAQLKDVKGMKIGIIKELGGQGWQSGVLNRFNEAVELLTSLGAQVKEISIPHSLYALATYYLIAPSEASSNLARFDGMRYGLRVDDGNLSAEEVMNKTRQKGFGKEVKRRIMIGTYALSSGYYDAYYAQAQKVRALIAQDLNNAFKDVDVLISPTSPTTAWGLGERVNDPMAMYLADLATLPPSLAGIPAMSVPIGLADEDKLPVGLQIVAPFMNDDRMYRVAGAVEAALKTKWNGLLIDQIPNLVGVK